MEKITKKVRVIASTYNSLKEAREMIGGEYEVRTEFYYDNRLSVWNKDKSDYCYFNPSDVQELTPLSYEGNAIAIGDSIKKSDSCWYKVYGYYWYDGGYIITTVLNDDYDSCCFVINLSEVYGHKMKTTEKTELQKAYEILLAAGKIKDGKVIEM